MSMSNGRIEIGPRPHHVVRIMECNGSPEGVMSVSARVLFSSEYPSVADRASGSHPHVNACDMWAAFSNVAHIAIREFKLQEAIPLPRIVKSEGNFLREIVPDREYLAHFQILKMPDVTHKGAISGGKASLEIFNGDGEGKKVASLSADFVTLKVGG